MWRRDRKKAVQKAIAKQAEANKRFAKLPESEQLQQLTEDAHGLIMDNPEAAATIGMTLIIGAVHHDEAMAQKMGLDGESVDRVGSSIASSGAAASATLGIPTVVKVIKSLVYGISIATGDSPKEVCDKLGEHAPDGDSWSEMVEDMKRLNSPGIVDPRSPFYHIHNKDNDTDERPSEDEVISRDAAEELRRLIEGDDNNERKDLS